jgi:hypothetical protein
MKNIHNQKNQGGDLYYLDFICLDIYALKAYFDKRTCRTIV